MKLEEALELIKFSYSNHSKDTAASKRPRVKVLDYSYPGRKGQKTYGKRSDLLGWNLNYFSNKRYARRAIDEIDSFARLLGAHNEEKYSRVKYFFPEQAKFLRRYMKKHVSSLKRRTIFGLWRKTNYSDLIKLDRDRF
jgi:hypothetical protein